MSRRSVLVASLIAALITSVGIAHATTGHPVGINDRRPTHVEPARPALPGQTLWAVVNSDGTLARGFGVVSSSVATDCGGAASGCYQVIFRVNVRTCGYIATIGLSGSSGVESPGQISVVGRSGEDRGVFVQTSDSLGNTEGRGFHLFVQC